VIRSLERLRAERRLNELIVQGTLAVMDAVAAGDVAAARWWLTRQSIEGAARRFSADGLIDAERFAETTRLARALVQPP
jgi:hypothetical protein